MLPPEERQDADLHLAADLEHTRDSQRGWVHDVIVAGRDDG
jgi:hypothetical protein